MSRSFFYENKIKYLFFLIKKTPQKINKRGPLEWGEAAHLKRESAHK